ncbi:hypothetical protein F5B22DRAFT_646943 [Xylaria bambusicola]|uniref:uncharacterized protein n=1 Tax=Xylaria bambusicola TaxID=326684 RepID=UPI002008C309|nr:uncharacterized protein F5B22DRAFT_646943 [Xylaria bambusicola]KAI0515065.1 hypothetical protein F5B22DRAFT_646943 [Xylaria bambusicola]
MENDWRNRWFPDGDASNEIKPAQDVLKGAQAFLDDCLLKLGQKVKNEFNSIIRFNKGSEESSKQPGEDLTKYINSLPLEQLSDYVNFSVDKMRDAGEDLSQKRSSGFHKRAARLQDFAVTFSHFLKAYSGVVSIIQNADAQFGNVAFAALSLLFATVKAKAEAEASIQSSILHISDRMPDFKVYERIYPDPKLGLMLSEAYRGIVLFARKVTIYFQPHGFVRYMRQFNRVAEFQLMEQEMRETSNRISERCSVLLAEKIDDLTIKNKMLQDRENVRIIGEIVTILNLQNYRTEHMREELKEEQSILKHQFIGDRRRQKIDARHFLGTPSGQFWQSPGRGLLLLYGRNEMGSSSNHSWLSPIATEIAEGHFEANNLAAYDRGGKDSTLERTLSRLIFQLLERNPGIVERAEDYREIESQISRSSVLSERYERLEGLRNALLRTINCCGGRVDIILNRPELCEAQLEESCTEYINTMLSLIRDTKAELKILVVLRSEFWDFEKNEKQFRDVDLKMFRAVRMDQGRS